MMATSDGVPIEGRRIREWAPLTLRVALGIGLMIHGGIKLFAVGGHENISHMVSLLGVPFADTMGWIIGAIEFFGGLGILLGTLFTVSVGLNVLNVAGLLVLGGLAGGIPDPLPGGDPLPEFREAFLILAGTLALFLSGPGRWAVHPFVRDPRAQGVRKWHATDQR